MNSIFKKSIRVYAVLCLALAQLTVMQAKMIEVVANNDFEDAIKSGKPVVARFFSSWCGVCKATKEPFSSLANNTEFSHVTFLTIDIDKHQGLAEENNIAGIPTFVLFKDGKKVDTIVGVNNMDTFKQDLGKKIHAKLDAIKTSIETPDAQQVTEAKEQKDVAAAAEQPKEVATTHGLFGIIKNLVMGIINAVMSIVMGIVNFVKGLFGR